MSAGRQANAKKLVLTVIDGLSSSVLEQAVADGARRRWRI